MELEESQPKVYRKSQHMIGQRFVLKNLYTQRVVNCSVRLPFHWRERSFGDDAFLYGTESAEKLAMLQSSRNDEAQIIGAVIVAMVLRYASRVERQRLV